MIRHTRFPYRRIWRTELRTAVLLVAAVVFCAQAAHAQNVQWQTRPLPAQAAQSRITFLEVDPGGYVWFGLAAPGDARSAALGVLDPMGEYMLPLAGTRPGAGTAIAFEPVTGEAPEAGALWIGSKSGVLVVERSGRTTELTSTNSPLPAGSVRTLYCARDATKWIAVSGNGVACVDAAFNWASYNRAAGLGSDNIETIAEDHQGNLWFGSSDQGASRLDRQGGWLQFTSSNSGLIGNRVMRIVEESPGRIWFLTPNGISVFDGASWMSYTGRNSLLGRFAATALVIDTSGNKWVGTDGAGLLKLDAFSRWAAYTSADTPLPDNRIDALTLDDHARLWIATPAGITSMGPETGTPATDACPGESVEGLGLACPFEQALLWQADASAGRSVELGWALPSLPFGGRAWYYGALWAGQDFSFATADYALRAERTGAQRLLLSGTFSQALFFVQGAVIAPESMDTQRARTSPFPERLPLNVAGYVLPGEHIPSDEPLIVQLAGELVRPESRADMYAALRDIVYSSPVQSLQLQASDTKSAVAGAVDVLRSGSGDRHARARLVCTLVRAAGLPARLVMDMNDGVWCQAWVANRGWISIESTYPVFDYVRPVRTGLPKKLSPAEHAVAFLSGRDDTLDTLSGAAGLSASRRAVPSAELKQPDRLRDARMLIAPVYEDAPAPAAGKIPLADNIFMHARQRGTVVQMVFEDGQGRELNALTPALDGLSSTVNVRDRLLWRFVARRLGALLVIENIECTEYRPTSSE